jgi:hypothetical protein
MNACWYVVITFGVAVAAYLLGQWVEQRHWFAWLDARNGK